MAIKNIIILLLISASVKGQSYKLSKVRDISTDWYAMDNTKGDYRKVATMGKDSILVITDSAGLIRVLMETFIPDVYKKVKNKLEYPKVSATDIYEKVTDKKHTYFIKRTKDRIDTVGIYDR